MSNQDTKNLVVRPPVVVIMGHIDHGKSTLLDYIRKTNIVAKEAGGITQHLGAYEVIHKNSDGSENKITFLDTPGHEAFGSVRSRGSDVADIAILIISAEDSVKPQTIEALNCIKKSKTPFIVAINKIDSPRANSDLVKQNLMESDVYVEGYGGDIPVVEISAKTGQNIPELLDMILLVAEVSELKANPEINAEGFIIESKKDKERGISATLLIKDGVLEQGQFVVCKNAIAPIRAIVDQNNKIIKTATFSAPVTISGWDNSPVVGEKFEIFTDKNDAVAYCNKCKSEIVNDAGFEKNNFGKTAIPLIIKADNQGSVDAIEHELKKIEPENAYIKIISKGIGNISETDIKMASGSESAFIVGFGIKADKSAELMAERLVIEVKTAKIIYELIDWLKEAIEKRRPRIETEEIIGEAKILKIFNKTKTNQVVGARVTSGQIKNGNKVKIMRREEEIGKGIIKELQQQKSKASEVSAETECGISIEAKVEIAPGDFIQSIQIVTK
jgi:translation initiation factor IF-2